MSHQITETDKMFTTRRPTWHGLGIVLDEYPTREEAQKMVHDWEPIPEPIYRSTIVIDEEGPRQEFEVIPGKLEYRRSDNGQHLSVNNESLAIVTNGEMWDVAEALQGGPASDVLYETGGSLKGGGLVWLMLRLAEPIQIKGDPNGANLPYYLLQNGHDGMTAFKGSATNVRVQCANTVRMADIDAKTRGTEFSFRHTVNVSDRVEEARAALAGWRDSIDTFKQLAELMITEKVSRQGELQFLERFIPAPNTALTSERVKLNIEEARGQFMAVYNSQTNEGITGTSWGLFQAASEWSEHIRRAKGNQMESKFKRALLTPNAVLTHAKTFALEAAHV